MFWRWELIRYIPNRPWIRVLALVCLAFGIFYIYRQAVGPYQLIADYKNTEYVIEGERVQLRDGVSEIELAPGSASKMSIRYFGNELWTDLNSDGMDDVVFLLTKETGGSGVFFYVVAGLNTKRGYIGSDGYLLGDRIAPQTINESSNPKHKNVIVVNYADRGKGEPFTGQPSVGKSVYLKIDKENRWGIVMEDFEGESR